MDGLLSCSVFPFIDFYESVPMSVFGAATQRSREERDAMGRAVASAGVAASEASSPCRETHC